MKWFKYHVPELGCYWVDASSIDPVLAECWYVYRDSVAPGTGINYLESPMLVTQGRADR